MQADSVAATSDAVALADRLDRGLEAMSLDLDPAKCRQLLQFLGLLEQWNRVYNLTSVHEPFDMLVVHVLDSLAILPVLDRLGGGSVLDVGSGAGLPAIPLAVARPAWSITSVDAVAKKIGFQLRAKAALRLANLTPLHQRVEALTLPDAPTVIVARAYSSLVDLVRSVDHLCGPATTIVAMKGVLPTSEIHALPADWTVDTLALDVPFLGAERCAVSLRRRDPNR